MAIDHALELYKFAVEKKRPPPGHPLRLEFPADSLPTVLIMSKEPSSRTVYTNALAAKLTGFNVVILPLADALSLAKSESLADSIRTHAGTQLSDIFVFRTEFEGSAKFAMEILARSGFRCAVHNAGDGANRHPTQALLNLATIKHRLGRTHDFSVLMFGDLRYSRTLNSDLDILRMLNARYGDIRIVTVCAPGTGIPEFRRQGLHIEEHDSFRTVGKCDIIMGTRIQRERYTDPMELARVLNRYVLGRKELQELFGEKVIVMHPGPRGPEIAIDISNDPRNAMWEQMTIGIALRMAAHRWSYLRLSEATQFAPIIPCRTETHTEMPNEDRLKNRREAGKADDYFQPIRSRGTIIDHIPPGLGHAVANVISKAGSAIGDGAFHEVSIQGRKDIVVLHGMLLNPVGKTLATFIAPGIKINQVVDGFFNKQTARISGATMPDALICPNEKCASHLAEAKPIFTVSLDPSRAVCGYCCREFTREELIRSTFNIIVETT